MRHLDRGFGHFSEGLANDDDVPMGQDIEIDSRIVGVAQADFFIASDVDRGVDDVWNLAAMGTRRWNLKRFAFRSHDGIDELVQY